MLFDDSYRTIKMPNEGIFKDRGSKFLSFAYPVTNETEIKLILSNLKKLHPSANHHCFAYRLGADKAAFRVQDDGEPSGSAGRPIYNQIQSADLTNILVVVIRYFGGTLLGITGLINAYKTASAEVIKSSEIIIKTVNDVYSIRFNVEEINTLMRIFKELEVSIILQEFTEDYYIEFEIRKSSINKLEDAIKHLQSVRLKYIKTLA